MPCSRNVLLVVLVTLALGAAPKPEPGQTAQSFVRTLAKPVSGKFLLYLPETYGRNRQQRWPLILFLHGMGERGDNLELVKKHGPPKLVASGKQFPFIIVSPQCPTNGWWSTATLNGLLDGVTEKYAVDADRVYLTGLSMGGFGAWSLAMEQPERFAAFAPICGGGDPKRADRIKHIPVWVFHGGKDQTVPIQRSQDMVDALKALGADVQFTIYPEAGHDSWTATYDNPKLYEWFLQHKRVKSPRAPPAK
jgi:predicted peptidase